MEKLDEFAQEVIYNAMDHSGNLCCMVSEEEEDVIPIPDEIPVRETTFWSTIPWTGPPTST